MSKVMCNSGERMQRQGRPASVASAEERKRLLLIDDAASAAYCWRSHLHDTSIDLEAVASFAEALARIAPNVWRAKPADYVIVDLRLDDGNGEDLLPLLADLEPAPAVAVASGYLDHSLQLRLAQKCVIAVDRDLSRDDALTLLECLDQRQLLIDPVTYFARERGLTEHETAILRGYSVGLPDGTIAVELGLARGTIASYWERIRRKTGETTKSRVMSALLTYVREAARFRPRP
jgi:DNA-binding NarL/FixJ family response regulator